MRRRGGWIRWAWVALVVTALALLGAASALAAPTFRWSGAAAKASRGWANTSNWEGGTAPSSLEPVALEFPALTSGACTSSPRTDTCYESENNLSGLTVESLQLEDSTTYVIAGEPITLGAGGLSAAPASNTTEPIGSILAVPMTLGAEQAWSIAGQSGDDAIDENQLALFAEVTGDEHLHVKLSEGGGLVLLNEDNVGPLNFEGSDTSRPGILNGVVELYGAELNYSDREPVSFDNVFAIGTGATGPLSTNAAEIVVEPGEENAEYLVVQSASLDPESTLSFAVNNSGATPGLDYGQLVSSGAVELNGAELFLGVADGCRALPTGQVYTLVKTTGAITGSFGNAAEGQEIPVSFTKGCALSQKLRIEYHRSGAVQSVTGTLIPGASSTTSLTSSPAAPITNQSVTLTATVGTSAGVPLGTVQFEDDGTPISVCPNGPLVSVPSGYALTCRTSFGAAGSPQHLSATFTPEVEANLGGSSATEELPIGLAPTETNLEISSSTASLNQGVSYTASVSTSAPGSVVPGGVVVFADGGAPIGACSAVSLQQDVSPAEALCQLSYASAGTHAITASYSGDANFTPSSSSEQALTVQSANVLVSPPYEYPSETTSGDAKLRGTRISVHAHKVAIAELVCSGATSCKGTLTLSVRETLKGKHGKRTIRSVKIGSVAFSVAAGKTVGVDVPLDATGRALMVRDPQLGASIRLTQAAGSTSTNIHLVAIASHRRKR